MKQFFNNLVSLNVETLLIVSIILFLLLRKIFKWIKQNKAKVKKVSILGNEVEMYEEKGITSPHANCIHGHDVVQVLYKQRKVIREIDKIELHFIPRDLMNYAEDTIDVIISKLEGLFLKFLKEKIVSDDLVGNKCYKEYKLALQLSKRILLREALRMIRENNFIEKDERGQFEDYKKMKSQNFFDTMSEALNVYYTCSCPTREEIRHYNLSFINNPDNNFNVLRIIESAIEKMKDISIDHYKSIQKKEKLLDDEIIKLFGG